MEGVGGITHPGSGTARVDRTPAGATLGGMRALPTIVRVAVVWSVCAIAGFALLAVTAGVPQGPEGELLAGTIQTRVQIGLLLLASVGVVVALRLPAVGGIVIVVAAAGIGVFAAFEYDPLAAAAPFLALLVPGALLIAHGLSARPVAAAIATGGLVLLMTVSGFAAHAVSDYAYGPTHPESAVRFPASPVMWVWSGAPDPTAARVTARLRDAAARARLVIGEDPGLATGVRRIAGTTPGGDPALRAFEVRGLTPGRTYHYAVEVDGAIDRARPGLLRTVAARPASFTVAFAGCARRGSNGAVFDAIRREDPDLYLILGDMFYGDVSEDDPALFRDEYDLALTRPAQQALYLRSRVAYIWDDHDYGPNDSGADSPSRSAAWTAYRQVVPHGPLPGGRRAGPVYQAFTMGRVRFVVMDLRSERSPVDAADGPGKSMLGADQRRWLAGELRDARAQGRMVVLVSSVPWIAAARAGADDWGGYAWERAWIARRIAELRVPVVMLAGDAHMVALDDGTNSDYSGTGRAGFPVAHGAALDRHGELKGGPYSEGEFPGGGQYGVMTVRDDGARLRVTLRGMDWQGRRLVGGSFVMRP